MTGAKKFFSGVPPRGPHRALTGPLLAGPIAIFVDVFIKIYINNPL
jgi:hypothetical protein